MAVVCIESARIPDPARTSRGWIVTRGTTYGDEHPAVLLCPDRFVTPDVWARSIDVEQATAAPGERRGGRRG